MKTVYHYLVYKLCRKSFWQTLTENIHLKKERAYPKSIEQNPFL